MTPAYGFPGNPAKNRAFCPLNTFCTRSPAAACSRRADGSRPYFKKFSGPQPLAPSPVLVMRRDFGWRHNELPDEIVQTYADMVYKLALSQTRNPDKAQDVFQEVFLRYIRNQKPFEGEEHRKAWLIRVTVNCCRNAFGFWETHTVALDEAVQAIPFESPEHGDVYYAMQSLPPRYRTVLHLFYYESMPIREIAAALRKKGGDGEIPAFPRPHPAAGKAEGGL